MTIDALVEQLLQLKQKGATQRTWEELETIIPPGITDSGVQTLLKQLASDCGCELRNQPQWANVVFVKK